MGNEIAKHEPASIIEQVVLNGDLDQLAPADRVAYYNQVCKSLGLNPYTQPFQYIKLNNKLTLYARRDCTDQLRKLHHVSTTIVSRETTNDVYVVTAHAVLPDGRIDESIGAVSIAGLRGDALANALMKCETKAKRRATLSIVGLGFLDETELETIPDAQPTTIEPTATQRLSTPAMTPAPSNAPTCHDCGGNIYAGKDAGGVMRSPSVIAMQTQRKWGVPLCLNCHELRKLEEARQAAASADAGPQPGDITHDGLRVV